MTLTLSSLTKFHNALFPPSLEPHLFCDSALLLFCPSICRVLSLLRLQTLFLLSRGVTWKHDEDPIELFHTAFTTCSQPPLCTP